MKRGLKALCAGLAVALLLGLGYGCLVMPKHRAVQEYVPGQGNIRGDVDAAAWAEICPEFEIGATVEGIAVFKDPAAAWRQFTRLYSAQIRQVRKENRLLPLTRLTWQPYQKFGWQTSGDCEIVSSFLDIYENSY